MLCIPILIKIYLDVSNNECLNKLICDKEVSVVGGEEVDIYDEDYDPIIGY